VSEVAGTGRMRLVPVRATLVYFIVLAGFWYAAVSQNNSMAYLLFFFLLGIGLASLPAGWRNLRGLRAVLMEESAGYADGPIPVKIAVTNAGRSNACGVHATPVLVKGGPQADARFDYLESGGRAVLDGALTLPRGLHRVGMLRIASAFPLGLWSWELRLPVERRIVVYPERKGAQTLPVQDAQGAVSGMLMSAGAGDDFRGHRRCTPGDSNRRIDWKAVARGHPRMVKEFEDEVGHPASLRWSVTQGRDDEIRLAQMAKWIWECHEEGLAFEFSLPGCELPTGFGPQHEIKALTALAAYRHEEKEPGKP